MEEDHIRETSPRENGGFVGRGKRSKKSERSERIDREEGERGKG